jgi:hypothetical protein
MRGKLLRIRSLPLGRFYPISCIVRCKQSPQGYNRAMDAATCFAALGAVFALAPICCPAIPARIREARPAHAGGVF